MAYEDWKIYREAAIMRRRRAGQVAPRGRAAAFVNGRQLETTDFNKTNSFDFYARWAFDNVIEMLCRAESDEEGNLAADLYASLYERDDLHPYLSAYQRASVTAERPDGEDQ